MRKRSIKAIFGFLIFVWLLLNNFFVSFAAENIHGVADNRSFSFISDVANIVMAIAAIANIWIVIWYYLKDKDLKNQEQETNNRLYWYRDVIVDKNINALEKFFERSLEITDQHKQLEMKKEDLSKAEFAKREREIFAEYNAEKYLVGQSFIDVVNVVNKGLGQDLYKLFDKFQDDFTLNLADLSSAKSNISYTKIKNLVYEQKRKALEEVYSYGFKNH